MVREIIFSRTKSKKLPRHVFWFHK
ncbi:DUF1661 domain-containing protein [Porphyromonas gingivalis]